MVLERLAAERGAPANLRSDNGPGLTAAELLERLGASADMLSRERPNPGEWEVAYVVLTRGVRKDTPYTLPFFSLANLASSARRLQDRGFKVSIAEVREV